MERKGNMKFSSSLKLNHIFRRLYHTSGQADSYLVLYARKNRSAYNRVGITASKKLGHAVVRNRARRVMRAALAAHLPENVGSVDIVLVARAQTARLKSTQLEKTLSKLLAKAGLPDKNPPAPKPVPGDAPNA